MKKRHIWFFLITVLIAVTTIAPALILRIKTESACHNYIASVNAVEFMNLFDSDEHDKIASSFSECGVTVATVKEENLTFNDHILKTVCDANLDIALFVDGTTKKDNVYMKNLENIVSQYNVKYICIENPENKPDVNIPLESLIADHKLTYILKENKSQLSNENVQNSESIIKASEGRLMRCSESRRDPLEYIDNKGPEFDYPDILHHQMINSVKERNTGFILINPINSYDGDATKNLSVTLDATSRFCETMKKSGYENFATDNFDDYVPQRKATCAGTIFVCAMMALTIFNILSKRSYAFLDWAVFAIAVLSFIISFILPESLLVLYPTAYALIAPCFILCLVAKITQTFKASASMAVYMLFMTIVLLFSMIISGAILSAVLSGYDYYFNILIFRGVKLTLITPILFAACTFPFICCDKGVVGSVYRDIRTKGFVRKLKECVSHIRLYHILFAVLVAIVGILYVVRSGNNVISPSEVKLRNLLADIFTARPRTKEFLVGWPAFALWMYCSKNNSNTFIKWLSMIACALLVASATNTFCHVFTDFSFSALRTTNGFVVALPIVAVVFLAIFVLRKCVASAGNKRAKIS